MRTPLAWWQRKVRFARQVSNIGPLSWYNLDGAFSNHVKWVKVRRGGPTLWWCTDMERYGSWPHKPLVGVCVGRLFVAVLDPRRRRSGEDPH